MFKSGAWEVSFGKRKYIIKEEKYKLYYIIQLIIFIIIMPIGMFFIEMYVDRNVLITIAGALIIVVAVAFVEHIIQINFDTIKLKV